MEPRRHTSRYEHLQPTGQQDDDDDVWLLGSPGLSATSFKTSPVPKNSPVQPRSLLQSSRGRNYIPLTENNQEDDQRFPAAALNRSHSFIPENTPFDYTTLHPPQHKPSLLTILSHPPITFTQKHKLLLATLLPLLSILLETTMLLNFLYTYLHLPINPRTNQRPRLSPWYSTWPFISCIGSTKLLLYQTISCTCSLLSLLAATISLHWARETTPGWHLRRLQFLETIAGDALLIALVFVSSHISTNTHLFLVSGRLALLYLTKSTGWLIGRSMRNTYPALHDDYASRASNFWKMGLMVLALPFAVLANLGIFVCWEPRWIAQRGSTCYGLMAVAAVSDWGYALVNLGFVANVAYDLWHDEHFGRARRGEGLRMGKGFGGRGGVGLEARRPR